jgi:AraC-like DNA-binding protein
MRLSERIGACICVAGGHVPSSLRVGKSNAKPASPSTDMEERVATQPDSPEDELRQARIGKILEIIKSGRPYTVRGLAVELNLSESHILHLFKRQTGLCLGHVLIEQKLQLSAQLLLRSDFPIKQIACAVGYGHTSSFTRAFARRFAESPWAYRHHNNPIARKY